MTIISFAIEYHFVKDDPRAYHLNNILLHLGVVALIFLFATQIGLSPLASGFAALLFGIHPIHVESVAWVSERKDVLYSFFFLLAVVTYWGYLKNRNTTLYLSGVLFGLLSMLAKPMALSLPFILFACDWLYERKFDRSMFLDKLLHFLYVIPISIITYVTWIRNPVENIHDAVLIWIWTVAFYIKKSIFPAVLLPHYLLPRPVSITHQPYLSSVLIVLLSVLLIWRFRKNRMLLFGWLYFIGSAFFLLRYDDVIQTGNLTLVADRFMYLPSLGFCLFLGKSIDGIHRRAQRGKFSYVAKILIVIFFGVLASRTFQQNKIWRNDFTLWNHVVHHTPHNYVALVNRGREFRKQGELGYALEDYNKALSVDPRNVKAYYNRGNVYFELNKTELALNDFNKALALAPNDINALINRGVLYYETQQYPLGLNDFTKAISVAPNYAKAYNLRGVVYSVMGQEELALEDLDKAIFLDPYYHEAYFNRGIFYTRQKISHEAKINFDKAKLLKEAQAEAYP